MKRKKYEYIVVARARLKKNRPVNESPLWRVPGPARATLLQIAGHDEGRCFMTFDEARTEAADRRYWWGATYTYKVFKVERIA